MLNCAFAARVAAFGLAVGIAGWVNAADTAPAPADYSEPRKAMETFLKAQDKAALLDALVVAPADQADVEAFVDVMDQTTKLQKAAQAEYGAGAAKYFSDVTGAELAAKIKSIETADVRIDGDSATVTMAANEAAKQASSTVKLKKVGADWKIDAASLFGLGSPATATEPAGGGLAATEPAATQKNATDRRVDIAHSITETTKQMIIDVKARKFASASDAYQEYWNRTRVAISRLMPPLPAATVPASAPQGGSSDSIFPKP